MVVVFVVPLQVPGHKDIHSSLILFVVLLLANNVFLLSDLVTYVVRPVIRFFSLSSNISQAPYALEFINSLVLHIFVDAYRRGEQVAKGPGEGSKVTLPPFAQHALRAQCRKLPLGYVVMVMKDLVRLNVQKSDSVLLHGSMTRHDIALGKVSLC